MLGTPLYGPEIQVREGGPAVFAITSNGSPETDENLTILVGNNDGGNSGFGVNPIYGGGGGVVWGDPHLTTFDGVNYNLQQVGEFVLVESTEPDDNFQVQIRTKPYLNSQSVAVVQQVALAMGADRITIDATRANPVWVDGSPIVLTSADPTMAFSAGLLERIAPTEYLISYDTGESVRVTLESGYLDLGLSAGPGRPLGTMEGLLGPDDGNPANDFMLPNGTILTQPLTQAQLYNTFANAWRGDPSGLAPGLRTRPNYGDLHVSVRPEPSGGARHG